MDTFYIAELVEMVQPVSLWSFMIRWLTVNRMRAVPAISQLASTQFIM